MNTQKHNLGAEERELQELLGRVMAEPLNPIKERFDTVDSKLKKLEESLAAARGTGRRTQELVEKIPEGLEELMEEVEKIHADHRDQGDGHARVQAQLSANKEEIEKCRLSISQAEQQMLSLHGAIATVLARLDEQTIAAEKRDKATRMLQISNLIIGLVIGLLVALPLLRS